VARPPQGPSLELDIPSRKAPKAAPKKKQEEELSLELAIDPRSLVQPAVDKPAPPSGPRSTGGVSPSAAIVPTKGGLATTRRSLAPGPQVGDIEFDARLLADFGDRPRHWLLSGLYAWRVLRRQREVRHALVGRKEEAQRSSTELEDALVALAERIKPAVEQKEGYADSLSEAKRAEETLRSRDAVLAADQDAHNARLAAVEARVAKLEAELVEAQAAERAIVAEIAASQGALGRAESKLKRAESELRAAAREGTGSES
jgi:hypothetical protein